MLQPGRFGTAGRQLTLAVLGIMAVSTGCQPSSSGPGPGPAQVDVSQHTLPQAEVSIAADPNDPKVLLAASNSFAEGTLRVYGTMDGGQHWTSEMAPLPRTASVAAADPWVGIDLSKRQYLALIAIPGRLGGGMVYVLSRATSGATWTVPNAPVAAFSDPSRDADDKDTLAIDVASGSPYRNRIYVAWSRNLRVMVAHSDDQAVTWSTAAAVSAAGSDALGASLGVSENGDVYLSWLSDAGVRTSRSVDGGDHWSSPTREGPAGALANGKACIPIAASPTACANGFPSTAVDRSRDKFAGRVYAAFAARATGGHAGVLVAAYGPDLSSAAGSPKWVDPGGGSTADRFHPVIAVDQQSGDVWVCFYDTSPDPRRIKTFFSCSVSTDGGERWGTPVHAATTPSDETQWRAFSGRAGREYGDYEGLVVNAGVAHPIWTDSRDLARLQEEIYTTTLRSSDFKPPSG